MKLINMNKIIFDTIGYGEKKCLMALYSVANGYLDNIFFIKQNDSWQVYYQDEETKKLICNSPLIFDACYSILKIIGNEDLTTRYINTLRTYVTSEKTDEFINEINEDSIKKSH